MARYKLVATNYDGTKETVNESSSRYDLYLEAKDIIDQDVGYTTQADVIDTSTGHSVDTLINDKMFEVRSYTSGGAFGGEYFMTRGMAKNAMIDMIYEDMDDDSHMCETLELIDCRGGKDILVERVTAQKVKEMRQKAREIDEMYREDY